jgi:hypothetical protein
MHALVMTIVLALAMQAAPRSDRAALDRLKAYLLNQPAFQADLHAQGPDGQARQVGHVWKSKMSYRAAFTIDGEPLEVLGREFGVALVFPDAREYTNRLDYEELVRRSPAVGFMTGWLVVESDLSDARIEAELRNSEVVAAGTSVVGGVECERFVLRHKERKDAVELCFAPSLGGALVSFDGAGAFAGPEKPELTKWWFSGVRLGVEASDLELPAAFALNTRRIPKFPRARNGGPMPFGFAPVEVRAGESVELDAEFWDPDLDTVTATYATPDGGRVRTEGGRVTFDAAGLAPGTYRIEVTFSDGHGHTAGTQTSVKVVAAERRP